MKWTFVLKSGKRVVIIWPIRLVQMIIACFKNNLKQQSIKIFKCYTYVFYTYFKFYIYLYQQ